VAGSAVWQLKDLAPYIKEPGTGEWRLLFRTPDTKLFTKVKKEMVHKTYALPFAPDPFRASAELDSLYSGLLEPVLPKPRARSILPFWK